MKTKCFITAEEKSQEMIALERIKEDDTALVIDNSIVLERVIKIVIFRIIFQVEGS